MFMSRNIFMQMSDRFFLDGVCFYIKHDALTYTRMVITVRQNLSRGAHSYNEITRFLD